VLVALSQIAASPELAGTSRHALVLTLEQEDQ